MHDRQLRAFIRVVEVGNISAAAKEMFISPQALLQQMNLLEKEIGCVLLNRGRHGVKLTNAGQVFYEGAVRLLQISEQMLADARRISEEGNDTVKILHCAYIHDFLYPEAIAAFSEAHLGIRVELYLHNLVEKSPQEFDITISGEVNWAEEAGFKQSVLVETPFFGIMKKSDSMACKKTLHIEDLKRSKLVVPQFKMLDRMQADIWNYIRQHWVEFQVEESPFRSLNEVQISVFTNNRVLISWGPQVNLPQVLAQIPISGFSGNICIYTKQDKDKPAVKILADFMLDYYRTHWDERLKAYFP